MRRRAIDSVTANPASPNEAAAERAVNEVWESCFNDTRPFDEASCILLPARNVPLTMWLFITIRYINTDCRNGASDAVYIPRHCQYNVHTISQQRHGGSYEPVGDREPKC